ncbi:alpha/beta hydrolase [Prochlorococcus marinus]|uniref:alpha/beta hydrolase n=1 Tax=Prochlorococcus marinus TaxID=1219 RepID=UPI0022B33229|nr:alpha/beta hydrolase [Prochlorococcus marinus]
MNLNYSNIILLLVLFFYPSAKSAEKLFLYKGTFSRSINIEELSKFNTTKEISQKLENLMKITNLNDKDLHNFLSYKIKIPLKTSSKLMNSKIGEVFLSRLSKIIYTNKISNKKTSTKAIRSAIILSSYKNNERMNLIDFFKEYPNKNIAIDLNALNKALEKVESLKELIDFYSNSPFQKLKDGSSST